MSVKDMQQFLFSHSQTKNYNNELNLRNLEPTKNPPQHVLQPQVYSNQTDPQYLDSAIKIMNVLIDNPVELSLLPKLCEVASINLEDHHSLWLNYYFRQISFTTNDIQLSHIKILKQLVDKNSNIFHPDYYQKLIELLNFAILIIKKKSTIPKITFNTANEFGLFVLHVCSPYCEDITNIIYSDFLNEGFKYTKNMDLMIQNELVAQLFTLILSTPSTQSRETSLIESRLNNIQKNYSSKVTQVHHKISLNLKKEQKNIKQQVKQENTKIVDKIERLAMEDDVRMVYFLIRILLIEQQMEKSTDSIYDLGEQYKIPLPKSKADISIYYRNKNPFLYPAISRLLSEYAFYLFAKDENSSEVEELLDISIAILQFSANDIFPLFSFAISYRWYTTILSKPKTLWDDVTKYFKKINWALISQLKGSFGLYQLLKIDYFLDIAIDYVCSEIVTHPNFEIHPIMLLLLYKKLDCNEKTLVEKITMKLSADMDEFITQTNNSVEIVEEGIQFPKDMQWKSISDEEIRDLLWM